MGQGILLSHTKYPIIQITLHGNQLKTNPKTIAIDNLTTFLFSLMRRLSVLTDCSPGIFFDLSLKIIME